MMKYKDKYIWALAGRFLPLFIYLATTMVLARFLTPEDFGMVGVLSVFFMVAKTLMDAGLGGSLVKEKEISDIDSSTILTFNVSVSLFLYFLIYVFSDSIETYFETPGLSKVVKILCTVFIINSFGLVPVSLLTRNLKFKAITITHVVSVFCAAIIAIVMAIYDCGVYALIAYQITSALLTVLLSIIVSQFRISFHFSLESFHRLIPFGLFTAFTTTIDTIYENMITFLFGKYLNMQQAGFLSQAKRLEEVPSQSVAQTISNVAFPVLTQLRHDQRKFVEECNTTFRSVMLLVLPMLFVMSAFSEPIIELIYGVKWIPAAPYLSMLIYAAIFHIAETLIRTFIKSTTQVQKLFIYTLIKRIAGILIIILFLFYDTVYVLYGYIASTVIGYLLNVHLMSKVSELTIYSQIKLFIKILIPNIIVYLLIIAVRVFISSLFLQIAGSGILLILYYFVVLKYYHINIFAYIKNNKKN